MRKAVVFLIIFLSLPAFAAGIKGEISIYLEHQIQDSAEQITAVAFSLDNLLVAFGDEGGGITVMNLETGERDIVFSFHSGGISDLKFSPEGRFIASASTDKTVRIVETEPDKTAVEMKGFDGRASELAFSDDGRYLAADGEDDDIFVWEIPSGHLRSRLKGHRDDILEIAFDQSEGRLISVDSDNNMMIWDLRSMKLLREYKLEARTISNSGVDLTCAEISSDGIFVAAGIDEHILRKGGRKMLFKYHIAFFDIEKGILLKILEDNNSRIEDLALYPGNCFVAFDNSTLHEKKLALRNIETADFALQYAIDAGCTDLAFSPEGDWLAGAVESSKDSGKPVLYIWKVDYQMPASGCFMGRLRLTSSSEPVITAGVPETAAVLPFGVSGTDQDIGRAAAHFMESKLAGNPYLKLVERSRVEDIVKELKFQQSELVDRKKAVKVGKLLGAAYIISGNVDRVGADLVISARIIQVESGEILGVREVHCGQCGSDDIYNVIDILAPALVQD